MQFNQDQSLERILESAVVVSWADLMHDAQKGSIHIEYGLAPSGTLDYLKIWLSMTRGYWLLACEYWMAPSTFHSTGIHFESGYQSDGLAHILESVMQHQTSFLLPEDTGRQGLLQILTPTQAESAAAAALLSEAFDCLGLARTHLAAA
jgi:hypothetical protein